MSYEEERTFAEGMYSAALTAGDYAGQLEWGTDKKRLTTVINDLREYVKNNDKKQNKKQ